MTSSTLSAIKSTLMLIGHCKKCSSCAELAQTVLASLDWDKLSSYPRLIEASPELLSEIHSRSLTFVQDNLTSPSQADFLLAESAMLIGASLAIQHDTHPGESAPRIIQ
jgi:hypothetical protein